IGLALLVLAVVVALTIGASQLVVRPLRRLQTALRDAAAGQYDFRISHARTDEFGAVFDQFNALVGAFEARAPQQRSEPLNFDATMIVTPTEIDAVRAQGLAS